MIQKEQKPMSKKRQALNVTIGFVLAFIAFFVYYAITH